MVKNIAILCHIKTWATVFTQSVSKQLSWKVLKQNIGRLNQQWSIVLVKMGSSSTYYAWEKLHLIFKNVPKSQQKVRLEF